MISIFPLLFLFLTPLSAQQQNCPSGTFLLNNICEKCPPGTYRNGRGYFNAQVKVCKPCPPGFASSIHGATGRDLCRPCHINTFAEKEGSLVCKPCPSGTASNRRAVQCLKCGPGSRVANNSKNCEKCKKGTYSDGVSNNVCKRCPPSMSTNEGAKSVKECRECPLGTFTYRGSTGGCLKCDPGSARGEGMRGCEPCFKGQFANKPGATKCKLCPPGTFQNYRSQKECKPCKPGTRALGFGNDECRVIGKPCAKWQFEDRLGDCKRCLSGERLHLVKKVCVKCPRGWVSVGGVNTKCVKCVNGQIPDFVNSVCGCPKGELPDRKGGCRKCPPGMYNSNSRPTGDSCFICGPGTFSKGGAVTCTKCPFGSVAPGFKSTKCTQCPMGQLPGSGFDFRSRCVLQSTNCPPGYKRTFVGALYSFFRCQKIQCSVDVSEEEIGRTCVGCYPGRFLNVTAPRNFCQLCRFDSISPGGVVTKCDKCPNALVHDEYDGSKCSCSGYRAVGKGLQDGVCKKCPPGTFSSRMDNNCIPCPIGSFSNKAGMEKCTPCYIDQYSNKTGTTKCTVCPNGTISDLRPGGSKCVAFHSSEGHLNYYREPQHWLRISKTPGPH